MSRTNPFKQKRRQAKKTLLVFGEGFGEEMFLKHLRSLYSFNTNVAITVKRGKGGTADRVIIDASKTLGSFDRKIVVLDNDKPKAEMTKARQEAITRGIELIENTPCLESVLISILDKKPNETNSALCKDEFESKYIDKKKRGEPAEYTKLFPKKLLDTQRLKVSELDKLVSILEGK
ncbi:MAG: hypothetical protein UT32_C0019G0007 [Parcubacteria group bacterium GW2011_GWC2_39_14]|nr:MAG: hypothetical protein UT32_C0019G0007 [Parcubacteria group bacterium GW2011_GWC2_39_14]KKR54540.1 MAG: hypothetical protein UT91_C0013G0007 [Parcubacteria group bacterium GW2011_GWA2_40_23]